MREGAGERFEQLELEIGAYFVTVTEDPDAALRRLSAAFDLPASELATHPHVLVGPVGAICDELARRREEYGISYVTVGASVAADFAPVVARLG